VTLGSVVVPARNAARVLDGQLAALAAQTIVDALEIVIVDNASADDTVARAERWRGLLPSLHVVRAAGRVGPGYARNIGIAAASSESILLCDADDQVATDWAEQLLAALREFDAVGGRIVEWDEPVTRRAVGVDGDGFGFGFLPAFATCNAALRRAAWQAIGGFDEHLQTCEDLDLAWRLQLAGFRVGSCPALVRYRTPGTPTGELRTWFRYGRDQPQLMARFGAAGLRREPTLRVAAKWGSLVVGAPRLLGRGAAGSAARRRWCREAGRRAGRVVGSGRAHTPYL
jgi:GT2 family glycosyltransferase